MMFVSASVSPHLMIVGERKKAILDQLLVQPFKVFDNGKGYIKADDLREIMKTLGDRMTVYLLGIYRTLQSCCMEIISSLFSLCTELHLQ